MVALNRILMTDLSGQKRYEVGLDSELTPRHTIGQAVVHYLDRMRIPPNGLRWSAYSRGVKLDSKRELSDLHEADSRWAVLPEVSAG